MYKTNIFSYENALFLFVKYIDDVCIFKLTLFFREQIVLGYIN